MEELRALVTKYTAVIKRYYIQYLSGYDAVVLNELIQTLPNVTEDESIILSSFCNKIADLNVDGLFHILLYVFSTSLVYLLTFEYTDACVKLAFYETQ